MDPSFWSWLYVFVCCVVALSLSKSVVVTCLIMLVVATTFECVSYPPPSKERVAAFLQFGRPLKRTTISGEYEHGLTNIAHRGAASDAPENTMGKKNVIIMSPCHFLLIPKSWYWCLSRFWVLTPATINVTPCYKRIVVITIYPKNIALGMIFAVFATCYRNFS